MKDNEELSPTNQRIVDNISKYINANVDNLNKHYYSVKTENNKNKKNDIYETINQKAYNNELLKVSVVILTANYYECEILNLNVFQDSRKKIKKLDGGISLFNDKHVVKAYIMEMDDYVVLHLHAPETGSNTPCGSSDLVRYVEQCKFLLPSCVISFGICYGTDIEEFSLGDTIIAEKIYPWSIGVKINNTGWNIKCDDYVIDLRNNDPILYDKIGDIVNSSNAFCPFQKAKMGNMLTAEAVVNNEQVKIEAIQKSYGCNIIGGEMEGYGLAKECIYYNCTPCIILKAICDWGTVKNIEQYIKLEKSGLEENYKDKLQAYTTFCAYKVLNDLFKNKIFKKIDIIDSIYKDLELKYYSDCSIRKSVLNKHIGKYLKDNFRAYSNISKKDKNKLKKRIICVLKKQYLVESENGTCYIFNQFFE